MSKDHILELVANKMSPVDLIERLEPYITTEDLLELVADLIDISYTEIFAEELEEYYE